MVTSRVLLFTSLSTTIFFTEMCFICILAPPQRVCFERQLWGPWVALSVKYLPLAKVMI